MVDGNIQDIAYRSSGTARPTVRPVTPEDVRDAFSDGMADWREEPVLGMAFGLVYAVLGALIVLYLDTNSKVNLIVPALSAFLLIGPGIALGLYEISRRLETGEPLEFSAVLSAGMRHGGGQMALLGVTLLVVAVLWMAAAEFIHAAIFGATEWTIGGLVTAIFSTWDGFRYAVIGTAVGAVFAAVTFALTVVAAPMLLDRNVDAATTVSASVAAVRRSPLAFLVYGVLVTIIIAAGMAAFMIGLLVALPVVGFTTWHLYRRAITW
ncbi:DUF2189 domain-containing protein [Amorphus orientalis]|uniref:Membrane protein n=1 Tax=Amorphus orientalis TaxID=649198 RepID=A0AAE3VRI6_9HYPH|nr:DUF2189 domain-containing protein [Amorphus orientalis]MDQ0317439.1 putative membrane protein [Amorphus orientalis]